MANPIILRTERLVLRPPLPQDAPYIAARIGVRDVAWNLGRAPYPYQLSDAEEWLERVPKGWVEDTAYVLVITEPEAGVIGCVGLDLKPMDVWEIGYWLGQDWWGHGYITEAARAVMDWAETDMGLQQFVSGHFTDNAASGRVLTKLGFEPCGEVELFGRARGRKSPAVRYTKGTDPVLALRIAAH
ncbi:MAG: GNAT family N-acetyltransferase [Henriciella sp.]|nr:GNAT family N-acetyltransferase [Henriciella sp.]